MKNRYISHSTLQSLLNPSQLHRIDRLASLVEWRYKEYEAADGIYPWFDAEESFEEKDALSLQFTPYLVMLDIVGSEKKAKALFGEAGRGCCGIDSDKSYPTLQTFQAVAKGTTPGECSADWCSKYWKAVKERMLSVVERHGIGEKAIEAICYAEQVTDEPIWFKWNDLDGTIESGIQILTRNSENQFSPLER